MRNFNNLNRYKLKVEEKGCKTSPSYIYILMEKQNLLSSKSGKKLNLRFSKFALLSEESKNTRRILYLIQTKDFHTLFPFFKLVM